MLQLQENFMQMLREFGNSSAAEYGAGCRKLGGGFCAIFPRRRQPETNNEQGTTNRRGVKTRRHDYYLAAFLIKMRRQCERFIWPA